jgi:hypothetical protein
MLVTIKVAKSQSCLPKTRDLRRYLTLDFIPVDASENGTSKEFSTRARKPSRFIDQGRHPLASQDRSLFYQRQMQANIQLRILPGQSDRILERATHHQQ